MSELVTAEELPRFCGQLKNPLFSFASCEHLAATSPANSFHSLRAFSNTRNIPQLSAAASCRLTNKQQENRRLGASHVCHAELSWDLCHLVCSVTPHSALQGWEAKGSHKQKQGATNRGRESQTEPVLPKGGGWKRHWSYVKHNFILRLKVSVVMNLIISTAAIKPGNTQCKSSTQKRKFVFHSQNAEKTERKKHLWMAVWTETHIWLPKWMENTGE